jgi:quinol monooxygenase YgiN
MVQLLVRLVAAPELVPDVLYAFRRVMRPAQEAPGCTFAQTFKSAYDDQQIVYVEEWKDAAQLRAQFGTDRFMRLLELIEASAERPTVEFRVITERHGLEYVEAAQVAAARVR